MQTYQKNRSDVNRQFHPRSPLARVSLKRKCPVCGHSDWCSFTDDGRLALCMRVAAGSFKRAANGAYLHRLTNESPPPAQAIKKPLRTNVQVTSRASIEHCDAVYEALVYRHLVLAKEHEANLLARGLDPVTIRVNGYVSTPTAAYATNVARALATQYDLEGVPGFYRERGQWCMMPMGQGTLIPVRDAHGRICGLMIRRDGVIGSGKYIWFSTNPDLTNDAGVIKFPHGTRM